MLPLWKVRRLTEYCISHEKKTNLLFEKDVAVDKIKSVTHVCKIDCARQLACLLLPQKSMGNERCNATLACAFMG